MGGNERIEVYEMAKEPVATKFRFRGSHLVETAGVNIASQMSYKDELGKM